MPNSQPISHLGTFDVENFGDLLYPILFRQTLRNQRVDMTIRHYSPVPGKAPLDAGYETKSICSLFQPRAEPHTLVVGGGDILRTDWDCVARHYDLASRFDYSGLQRSIGSVNALGYLLLHHLPRKNPNSFFADRFRSRWFDYAAPGPFLIDPDSLPQGSSVSYISCGVPRDFTALEGENIQRTLDRAQFIYLRDEQSAAKLRQAGVSHELQVAPDLAITLSDQFSQSDQAVKGRNILCELGIGKEQPVLCFQSNPYPGFDADEIAKQLLRYRERTATEVVLLPIGYCHGDYLFLQEVARYSMGLLKYAPVTSIFDIIGIIATSDLFIGTSLHGNITALSFGIPHLFGPLPVDKTDGCLNVMNLPRELKLDSWSDINDRIEMAMELGPVFFSERAQDAKAKVYRVMGELFHNVLNLS
jgi:hypothetical protein